MDNSGAIIKFIEQQIAPLRERVQTLEARVAQLEAEKQSASVVNRICSAMGVRNARPS